LHVVGTQRDLRTGIIYYLLQEFGKSSARWESSLAVDLPALIRHLLHRRKNRLASAKAIRERKGSLSGQPEPRAPLQATPVASVQNDGEKKRLEGIKNIILDYRSSFLSLYMASRPSAIRESDLAALRVQGLDALETFLKSKGKRKGSDLLGHLLRVETDAKTWVETTNYGGTTPSTLPQPAPRREVLPRTTSSAIATTSSIASNESRPQCHDTPFAGSNHDCRSSLTTPAAQFTAVTESESKGERDSRYGTTTGEMHGQSETSKMKIETPNHGQLASAPLNPNGCVVSNSDLRYGYKKSPMSASYHFTASTTQKQSHDVATPQQLPQSSVAMSSRYPPQFHSKLHQRGAQTQESGLESRVRHQHTYWSHEPSRQSAKNHGFASSQVYSDSEYHSFPEPRYFASAEPFGSAALFSANPSAIPGPSQDGLSNSHTYQYPACNSVPSYSSHQGQLPAFPSTGGRNALANHEVSSYSFSPFHSQWSTLNDPHHNLASPHVNGSDSYANAQRQARHVPVSAAPASDNLPVADFGSRLPLEPAPPEVFEGLGLTAAQVQLLLQHRYSS
jgi:hypothetical protein